MFAVEDIPPISIPSWVEQVALPKYPHMEIAGFVLLAGGLSILLIGYFAPIKKTLSLLAGLSLLGYYPLAYLAHWFLFRYDEESRALRERNKFEDFLYNHTHALDWTLLGLCAFVGLVFLIWTVSATLRKNRRLRTKTATGTAKPFASGTVAPSVARPQPAARPAAPRPAAAPVRKVVKKPPAPPPSGNPFDFT